MAFYRLSGEKSKIAAGGGLAFKTDSLFGEIGADQLPLVALNFNDAFALADEVSAAGAAAGFQLMGEFLEEFFRARKPGNHSHGFPAAPRAFSSQHRGPFVFGRDFRLRRANAFRHKIFALGAFLISFGVRGVNKFRIIRHERTQFRVF